MPNLKFVSRTASERIVIENKIAGVSIVRHAHGLRIEIAHTFLRCAVHIRISRPVEYLDFSVFSLVHKIIMAALGPWAFC